MPTAEAIAEALGLTAAEARILSAFTASVSLTDTAKKLGVSINAARALLARAMGKAGTNSQLSLVRLVLTSLGPIA